MLNKKRRVTTTHYAPYSPHWHSQIIDHTSQDLTSSIPSSSRTRPVSRPIRRRAKVPQVIREREHEVPLQHHVLRIFNIPLRHIPLYALVLTQQVKHIQSQLAFLVLQQLLAYAHIPEPVVLVKARRQSREELVVQVILEEPALLR